MAVARDVASASPTTNSATTPTEPAANAALTIGAGANRLVIAALNLGNRSNANGAGTAAATAVKGGVDTAMSTDTTNAKKATGAGDFGYCQLFWLSAPDSGSNTVKGTVAGGTTGTVQDLIIGAVDYTGADTAPVAVGTNAGQGTTPTITFTATAGATYVAVCASGSSLTVGPANSGITKLWGTNLNGGSGAGNHWVVEYVAPSSTSVTLNWTQSSDYWGVVLYRVPAAAAAYPFELLTPTPRYY